MSATPIFRSIASVTNQAWFSSLRAKEPFAVVATSA